MKKLIAFMKENTHLCLHFRVEHSLKVQISLGVSSSKILRAYTRNYLKHASYPINQKSFFLSFNPSKTSKNKSLKQESSVTLAN